MSKLVPISGVLGLGGAIGGGAFLSSKLASKPETIKSRLEKEGYKVLNTTSSDHWNTILTSYKTDGNKWQFENLKSKELDDLKKICSSKAESNYSETLYKAFTKWCVVPRKAEDLLKGSVSLLDVDSTHANDKEDWRHNIESYEKAKTSDSKYSLQDVTFTANQEDQNVKALKTGCKTRREKFTYDIELDISIDEIKKWCLAKGK
ncbi:hypothetical protein HF1_04290 [Mycoplasma haemofelis str. Langford 1]|uniref:Uncharacterized protein n=1 Tax=Mycoplasma haemofelis (strain Langford 1) TaxID=941640 RepID=E8ZH16_MYCHL|nr:hypothetical protein [Mycoplasma haemofelis]CBY92437.1 hypothetical protein HF1_04290 [Mycoplasma haemofelis str. Langford 1]